MVKIGNRDLFGFVARDPALKPPSSSDSVESSDIEIDSSSDSATAGSSGSDGKEGTQLVLELDIATDAGGSVSSSSSSSSGALELGGVLLQATPQATDNMVAVSDLDLALASTGCQGSDGGGNGGRRSISSDQFPQREGYRRMYAPRNNRHYEVGSWSQQQAAPRQWRRVSPPNSQVQPQQGPPEFRHPFNFRPPPPPPGFRMPPNMNLPPTPPPWSAAPRFATGLRMQRGPPPMYMYGYGSPASSSSIYPPSFEVASVVPARRSSGLYPPPGVTIRRPVSGGGDPPEPPARTRVAITAPPSRPTPVSTSSWPPIAEEDALFAERLHGPSRRSRRLPVFEDICPGDEPSQSPPPSQPSPPPPGSP